MRRTLIMAFLMLCPAARYAYAQSAGRGYLDSLKRQLSSAAADTAIGDIMYSLATGYYKAGDYGMALQYNYRLQQLSSQLGDKETLGATLVGIGRDYHAIAESKSQQLPDSLLALSTAARLQRAHYYLARAIEVQKESGNVDMLQECYEHLSRVQLLQGDTAGSRESFKRYNNYLAGLYNKDKGAEVIKKDLKEVYTKKQEVLKQQGAEKQLSLQKEIDLNSLRYEYEKKQAAAQTEEERAQLKYEEEARSREIAYDFERKQAVLVAAKEKNDAVNAILISQAKKQRNYYIAGLALLALICAIMLNRFMILRRNRKVLEEKNKQIADEKEKADAQRVRAENSEQFKQQFLANMSHEIRTPMNAVSGMTELLLNKKPRTDQVDYLQAISKSSDILLHIINDILDLSKIEAGKMELESIDFSLAETLKQVSDTLSHRADEKGLQLMATIDDDVPDVLLGDPYRLNQILINLGGNAIKFTEKGGVQVRVQKLGSDAGSVKVRFSIIDTGVGIPEDKVGALFQSFTQVNSSDTRKHGGTGLGLSISKQLVELQGGTIAVESKQGSGTTFSFDLGYKAGSAAKLQQRINQEHGADGSVLNGLRILVADDNEYNRIVVSETLQLKAEVAIDMAVNGAEAIRMVEQRDYDVILMDVQMPVMNGIDATCHIRKKLPEPKRSVPIIALTASIMRSDVDKCTECGMNSYVPKPFKTWQLINTIADVTGRKGIPVSAEQMADDEHAIESDSGMITSAAYLHKFCEGDKKRMDKYIRMYLKAVPPFKEKLNAAVAAKDVKEIGLRIHAFKPNWMIMGMKETGALATKIEHQCAEQSDQVYDTLQLLLAHTEQSVAELQGNGEGATI